MVDLADVGLDAVMAARYDAMLSERVDFDQWTAAALADISFLRKLSREDLARTSRGQCWTPLMYACCLQTENFDAVISFIRNRGIDLDTQNSDGQTALILASANGNLTAVRILLEGGARLDLTDNRSRTALFYAARYNHVDCLVELINSGANVDASTDEGQTALLEGASAGLEAVVHMLLQHSADPTRRNKAGETPARLARDNRKILSMIQLAEKKRRDVDGLGAAASPLVAFLAKHQLEHHAALFGDLQLEALLRLTESELKRYALTVGARKKLARAIEQHLQGDSAQQISDMTLREATPSLTQIALSAADRAPQPLTPPVSVTKEQLLERELLQQKALISRVFQQLSCSIVALTSEFDRADADSGMAMSRLRGLSQLLTSVAEQPPISLSAKKLEQLCKVIQQTNSALSDSST